MIERIRLVRTVEKFGRFGRRAIQGLVLEERVIVAPELQPLLVREVHIDSERILALVLRMESP